MRNQAFSLSSGAVDTVALLPKGPSCPFVVQVSHLCCSPGLTAWGTCSWQWHWLSEEAEMWLKHSDMFLLWSKDLMPPQGVPWSFSLPNNSKSPVSHKYCIVCQQGQFLLQPPQSMLLKKALSPQEQLQSEAESLGFRGFWCNLFF